jgi:hypothetical protein
VIDILKEVDFHAEELRPEDFMAEGYNGVMCIEAGGPPAGTGCGGYVVGQTVKLLKQHHLLEDTDVVLFDVLGDVVCGGLRRPAAACRPRGDRDGERFRLDLRHEPDHRRGSGEVEELQRAARRLRRQPVEGHRRGRPVLRADGFKRIGHMPDVDAIRRSRLKKKTLFEMPDDEDIVQCRAEYIRLAETAVERDRPADARSRWKTATSLNCWGSIDGGDAHIRRHARPGRSVFRRHRDQDMGAVDVRRARLRHPPDGARGPRPDARDHAVAAAGGPDRPRVLDAGCGTGAMTEELARRGAEVVAIDISPQLVDIAEKAHPRGAARADHLHLRRHAVPRSWGPSTTSWRWIR